MQRGPAPVRGDRPMLILELEQSGGDLGAPDLSDRPIMQRLPITSEMALALGLGPVPRLARNVLQVERADAAKRCRLGAPPDNARIVALGDLGQEVARRGPRLGEVESYLFEREFRRPVADSGPHRE